MNGNGGIGHDHNGAIVNNDYIVRQLRSQIFYLIDNDLLQSAEFACERLNSQTGSDDSSVHLYGLVLYKRKKYGTAINATINRKHVGCAYVCAQAASCLEEYDRGERVLSSVIPLWQNSQVINSELERNIIPDAAACFTLLGRLHSCLNNKTKAAWAYSEALKLNPFIFEAFEELCKMGAQVRTGAIYKVVAENESSLFPSLDPDNVGRDQALPAQALAAVQHTSQQALATPNFKPTKNFFSGPLSTPDNNLTRTTQQFPVPPDAPTRKPTRQAAAQQQQQTVFDSFVKPSDTINRRNSRLTAAKVTSRLISHPLNSLTGGNSNNSNNSQSLPQAQAAAAAQQAPSSTLKRGRQPSISNNTSVQSINLKDSNGETYLMNLYLLFARAYKASCSYDCYKAIRLLSSLPENEKNTPWVMAKLGRLHFEIVNYEESLLYFNNLRELDRTRLEDMEYFSTLLWHLHDESRLSYLAHELASIDEQAPQTWVAAGNSFSLRKDSEQAVKCFQKAAELDRKFAYAFTLHGHEDVSNDSFESALQNFRGALSIDDRHYNALYGIGMVYLKLGDFLKAEYHFRKALEINPVNCILICCLGMVLEKLDKKEAALKQYMFAHKLQPLSALALFKKAQLLFSMEDFENAIVDFEQLVNLAPDEASVHFLLGQLYKISGRRLSAVKEFTTALNLDPKGAHLIKEAMESVGDFSAEDSVDH